MNNITVVSDLPVTPEQAKQLEMLLKPFEGRFVNGLEDANEQQKNQVLAGTDVLYVRHPRPEIIKAAPHLKWAHQPWVGVNMLLVDQEVVNSPFILTNGAGIIAAPVADLVLAYILSFARQMPYQWEAQKRREWDRRGLENISDELAGKICGVIGYGKIGTEIGKRAQAFGMRVIATRTHPERPAQYLDQAFSNDQLPELLAQSDYVVVTAPSTPATRGLLGKAEFEQMKKSAILINIARGQLIKEQELVEALQNGTIAGAGLDVFEKEPLPSTSPLWDLPNVLLTPHSGGIFQKLDVNSFKFFYEQLERFLKGEELQNIVDKKAGY
ncbi:MAG: D-2-hydroxyacid dehydrogenase [Chloroflexi bacterium]|nr:D-2-hydroxyacid dehydrogenase [Chloroflexota bacterium]